jgi:L-ribulose-5-phosphate 3-epimerase
MTFGIMQGRLSPAPAGRAQAFPWTTWLDEFGQARASGFDGIEWLVTADRPADNPLLRDAGTGEILAAAAAAGVKVTSVCADCFIRWPLRGVADGARRERIDLLEQVVRQAARIGALIVVLPLLEGNRPASQDDASRLLSAIDPVLQIAATLDVRIALETDWPGERLRAFIAGAGAPALGGCYDIGNAAALGLNAPDDLHALGPLLIHVHVKDRRSSGESVPLGRGDADLAGAFRALDQIGYAGTAVLETPAGTDAAASASRNLAVARAHASRTVGIIS